MKVKTRMIMIIIIIVAVHTMKALSGVVYVYLHSFLTSAIYGGQFLTSCPGRFKPDKEPRCH